MKFGHHRQKSFQLLYTMELSKKSMPSCWYFGQLFSEFRHHNQYLRRYYRLIQEQILLAQLLRSDLELHIFLPRSKKDFNLLKYFELFQGQKSELSHAYFLVVIHYQQQDHLTFTQLNFFAYSAQHHPPNSTLVLPTNHQRQSYRRQLHLQQQILYIHPVLGFNQGLLYYTLNN